MIEINLLPEELRKKDERIDILAQLPIKQSAIILVAAFFVIQFLVGMYTFYASLHLQVMKAEVASLTVVNKEIIARKVLTDLLRKKIEQSEGVARRPFYWASFLNALSGSMTKGVWLTGLSVANEGQVNRLRLEGSVVGKGEETAYAGKFIKELKSNQFFSEIFDEIELSTINQKKIKEFDVYDFVILCNFKKGKL